MSDRDTTGAPQPQPHEPQPYEPPRADDVSNEETPSVTAAGASNVLGFG